MRVGNWESAIADYTGAVRLWAKDAAAYYNRGVAYQKKGDHGKAKLDFGQAKRLGFKPQ